MKTIIALALFGLLLAGTAAADPAPAPPWATLKDLEPSVTQVFEVAGCGDTRPIGLLVVTDGPDTYVLIVKPMPDGRSWDRPTQTGRPGSGTGSSSTRVGSGSSERWSGRRPRTSARS